VPSWTAASATGVTSVAMTTPTGLTVTGSPITSSGTLALSLSTGYEIPTTTSQTNWNTAYNNRITSASSPLSITSNALSLGTVPVSSGGTGATTFATNNVLLGNGTSALQVVAPGSSGNVLTSNGTTWTSAAAGVPYSGATGAVNLGAYDLTVNGLTVGRGGTGQAENTAIGYGSLAANSTGNYNTSTGYGALNINQGGSHNAAFGHRALLTNVSGEKNTSVGSYSLWKNTASGNTAVGYGSLVFNQGGSNNVAIGNSTMQDNTSGSDNTALGKFALLSNSTGNYNIAIGSGADVNSTGLNNTIAIGYGARVSNNNTIQLGPDGTSFTVNSVAYPTTAISNVRTSGTLTLKDVTYPNTHRSAAGDVLTISNTGIASWAAPAASGVPYSGATGGVDLGDYDLTVRGLTIGKGTGNGTSNVASTAIGVGALANVSNSGGANTAFGYQTLTLIASSNNNTAIGATALKVSTGSNNTAVGSSALVKNTSGSDNVAIGSIALSNNLISSKNVAIGTAAGESMTGGLNTAIGAYSDMATNTFSNATAIGYGARAQASNTIQLGADGVTQVNSVTTTAIANVRTSGTLTLGSVTYPNSHASSNGQVLTVNGSGVASWATPSTTATAYSGTLPIANGGTNSTATATNGGVGYGTGTAHAYTSAGTSGQVMISAGAAAPTWATLQAGTAITISNSGGIITITAAIRPISDEFTASAGQTVFTLSQTPLTNPTTSPVRPNVWMFINGVRTKNLAYAVSGTSVTYTASNNNSYTLVAGDRIQFDYAY
jgi:hypothetical protein